MYGTNLNTNQLTMFSPEVTGELPLFPEIYGGYLGGVTMTPGLTNDTFQRRVNNTPFRRDSKSDFAKAAITAGATVASILLLRKVPIAKGVKSASKAIKTCWDDIAAKSKNAVSKEGKASKFVKEVISDIKTNWFGINPK